jgi:hypothetical protein
MAWVLIVSAGWLLLAVLIALVLGRAIHLADRKAERDGRPARPKRSGVRKNAGRQTDLSHLRPVDSGRPSSERMPSEPSSPLS